MMGVGAFLLMLVATHGRLGEIYVFDAYPTFEACDGVGKIALANHLSETYACLPLSPETVGHIQAMK
jgi:hypothetical protein